MSTNLYVLTPANVASPSQAHLTKGAMMKAGTELRKSGRGSVAKQIEWPKMPKGELMAAVFNRDFSTATITDLRTFEPVKRPMKEPV